MVVQAIQEDGEEMIPHESNFCGGNFQDWLEVYLTDKCNGKCSWCIDRNGLHPKYHASAGNMLCAIAATGKQNIILLGGEPTLYPKLWWLIYELKMDARTIYLTTNGSKLTREFIHNSLRWLDGINISIHSFSYENNQDITGIDLSRILPDAVKALHENGTRVRLNCTCIPGYIDSCSAILLYIAFAKAVGADEVRFAELKGAENFVDLARVMNYEFGLNDDPFTYGCNKDAVIDGMPVNFRQMCGLQTPNRIAPIDPVQHDKQVLYCDGKIYDGWQEAEMANDSLTLILKLLADGKITVDEAERLIREKSEVERISGTVASSGGCRY